MLFATEHFTTPLSAIIFLLFLTLFLEILAITSPIFALVGVGYACTRWGVFAKADMRVLGKFVIHLALPALIFKALASRPVADVFNTTYLLGYALGSLGALAVVYAVCRRGFGF